jgi:hypothetical protein
VEARKRYQLEDRGVGVSRELWTEHRNLPDMVRDSGLAFPGTDDGGREVYCPVCLKHRGGDGKAVVNVSSHLGATLRIVREEACYAQLEHKLHALHQVGVDIGSTNHSR